MSQENNARVIQIVPGRGLSINLGPALKDVLEGLAFISDDFLGRSFLCEIYALLINLLTRMTEGITKQEELESLLFDLLAKLQAAQEVFAAPPFNDPSGETLRELVTRLNAPTTVPDPNQAGELATLRKLCAQLEVRNTELAASAAQQSAHLEEAKATLAELTASHRELVQADGEKADELVQLRAAEKRVRAMADEKAVALAELQIRFEQLVDKHGVLTRFSHEQGQELDELRVKGAQFDNEQAREARIRQLAGQLRQASQTFAQDLGQQPIAFQLIDGLMELLQSRRDELGASIEAAKTTAHSIGDQIAALLPEAATQTSTPTFVDVAADILACRHLQSQVVKASLDATEAREELDGQVAELAARVKLGEKKLRPELALAQTHLRQWTEHSAVLSEVESQLRARLRSLEQYQQAVALVTTGPADLVAALPVLPQIVLATEPVAIGPDTQPDEIRTALLQHIASERGLTPQEVFVVSLYESQANKTKRALNNVIACAVRSGLAQIYEWTNALDVLTDWKGVSANGGNPQLRTYLKYTGSIGGGMATLQRTEKAIDWDINTLFTETEIEQFLARLTRKME